MKPRETPRKAAFSAGRLLLCSLLGLAAPGAGMGSCHAGDSLSAKGQGKVVAFASENDAREERKLAPKLRLAQTKELLGKEYYRDYKDTVLKQARRKTATERLVRLKVKLSLRGDFKKQYRRVARALLTEAQKHGLDPFFLMAVISHESSFNPLALGTHTEIGLMQLKPTTARWIAEKNDMDWKGGDSLKDPVVSIQIGAAYLAHLRDKFDSKGKLYMEAYNIGPLGLQRAIANRKTPKEYATQVMKHYVHYYLDMKELFEEPSSETAQF